MATPSTEQPRQSTPDRLVILAISLFLAAIYLATPVLYPRGLDEMSIMAAGRSLQGHLSFDVDTLGWTSPTSGNDATLNGPDGHTYTPKDVSASVLAAPFIKLAYLTGASPIHAAHLPTILVAVLAAVMVFLTARVWGYGRPACIGAALTFGLAGQAWPYSTSLMTQSCAALGLAAAVWGVSGASLRQDTRAAFLAGLGMSLAGLSATSTWIAAPLFALYLVPWEKRPSLGWGGMLRTALPTLVAFCAASGIGLLAGAIYNAARFGSPFDVGQSQAGNVDFRLAYLPVGVFGLLFSSSVGLVWFTPFVLLVPFGIVIGIRAGQARQTILLTALIVLFLLFYGSYFLWWADTEWGPRYLMPVGSCFVLLALPVIDRVMRRIGPLWVRALAIAVLAISALTQLMITLLDFTFISQETHRLLTRFTPPATLRAELPFLTNLRLLPYVQALTISANHKWAVLWMAGGHPDWPLLLGGVGLVAAAGVWLWMALRRPGSRLLRPGMAAQAGLWIVFAGVLLARYPHAGLPFHAQPPVLPGLDQAVAHIRGEELPGDGVVTLLYPTESYAWHDYFDASIPDIGLTIQPKLDANARLKLDHLPGWYNRIWLVSNATTGANPDNAVERSLSRRAFVGSETWFGNWRVVPYTLVPGDVTLTPSGAQFGDPRIMLTSFSYQADLISGRWINVRLQWQTDRPLAANNVVFVHLLDTNGHVVAQQDGLPQAGYAPTTGWEPGKIIDDRHALLLPLNLPVGAYRLTVGLYDSSSGARLPLAQGGDALTLQTFSLPLPSK